MIKTPGKMNNRRGEKEMEFVGKTDKKIMNKNHQKKEKQKEKQFNNN